MAIPPDYVIILLLNYHPDKNDPQSKCFWHDNISILQIFAGTAFVPGKTSVQLSCKLAKATTNGPKWPYKAGGHRWCGVKLGSQCGVESGWLVFL